MSHRIDVSFEIAASPAHVFAAWTEPAQVLAWWSIPGEFRTTDYQQDLRVGGRWRATFTSEDGGSFGLEGVYSAIAPDRLVTTFKADWDEGPTDATLTFAAHGSGMIFGIAQSGFASEDEADANKEGWIKALERLKAYLEGQP